MALIQDIETHGERQFTHTYSDAGMLIKQNETGVLYDDALDLVPCPYTYTETDQPADVDSDIYAEAGHILLGE